MQGGWSLSFMACPDLHTGAGPQGRAVPYMYSWFPLLLFVAINQCLQLFYKRLSPLQEESKTYLGICSPSSLSLAWESFPDD